jgi:hypothetical protein
MRADMSKVIVERPRFGSRMRGGPTKGRPGQRLGMEHLPKREGMARHYSNVKHFNEHLGPLGRYIESQVGRPWDQVFAEICAHINRGSAVQDHVRDHIWDFVTTEVILIDGVPHRKAGAPWGKVGPLVARGRRGAFYVCPLSGILKRVKRQWRRPQPETPAPSHRLSDLEEVRRVGRQWFLIRFKKVVIVPRLRGGSPPQVRYDELSRRPLSKRDLMQLPVPIDLWRR